MENGSFLSTRQNISGSFYSIRWTRIVRWTRVRLRNWRIFHVELLKMLVVVVGLIAVVVVLLYQWLRRTYDYWPREKVKQIAPNFMFGNLLGLLWMQRSTAEHFQQLYNHTEAVGEPYVGIYLFHTPALLIRDPDLIKLMLVKDFSMFSDRYANSDSKRDAIGSLNIFFLKNPAWKDIRSKLSPFFTINKIKQMFHLVAKVGQDLDSYLLSQPLQDACRQSFRLEMKELCALYTTDVIASVAYGIDARSFQCPNAEFRRYGRDVFRFSVRRAIEFTVIFFLPHWVRPLRLRVVPPEAALFLRNVINDMMRVREQSGHVRHDLIDILIEFKNTSRQWVKRHELEFECDILVAQAALFFTAGFETSSATMSFALYHLAKRPDLQDRLRAEIRHALADSNGTITPALIDSLEFMQMVILEVLRLYPPLPFLDRECTVQAGRRYALQPFGSYAVPKGMPILVPVYAIHMDPKYYPNPEEFDPERFSPLKRKSIHPGTYLPFGQGPHACIGERFAMLQTKIGLLNFLRNHYVAPCSQTRQRLKLDPRAMILQAEGGIYLDIVRDPL